MRPTHFLLVPIALATLTVAPRVRAAGPTVTDCLAATESSLKLKNEHKLRAARSQLLVCAAPSCPSDVRADCTHGVDELNAQVPTVIFAGKDASGADLNAVKITMDGEVLAPSLEGVALAVDPGEHTFTFETAGQPPVTKKLTIQQSQKDRHEAIVFAAPPAVVAPPPTVTAPAPPPALPPPEPPPPTAKTPLGTQKILAIVAGGVGVVGLGLGGAFGAIAVSDKSSAKSACPGATCANQAGSDKWSSAAIAGNISTIGFIVGGVGVAGAAVLWFSAPKTAGGASAQVGFGPGAFQVRGSF
jgi:hypothetical protein